MLNNKIRFQWFTILAGLLLMAGKFIAYRLTSSNIILTDALESLVNIATGAFGLYSLYLAAKPRDTDHPYGHGKIEFISAGLEGGLIGLAGLSIVIKSAYNLFYPEQLENLDIGLVIVGAAGLINFFIGHTAERIGRRDNSLTLVASGKHLKTDAYSTAGMLVGIGLILLTGFGKLDSIIAILIGLWIIRSGVLIVKTSVGGIMDQADFELIEQVVEHLESSRKVEWIDIHNLRIIKYGDAVHIDCHVTLPWYYDVKKGHDEIEKVEFLISEKLPNNIESFIHVDPCISESCPYCQIGDCEVRQRPFRERITWTMENVMKNKKHAGQFD